MHEPWVYIRNQSQIAILKQFCPEVRIIWPKHTLDINDVRLIIGAGTSFNLEATCGEYALLLFSI